MILYAIRHKATGKLMPEYKNGKGYSYWLADDIVDNQRDVPRLLSSSKQAQKCINEWAKGYFKWVDAPDSDPASFFIDKVRKMHDIGRSKDDLEVVMVTVLEVIPPRYLGDTPRIGALVLS